MCVFDVVLDEIFDSVIQPLMNVSLSLTAYKSCIMPADAADNTMNKPGEKNFRHTDKAVGSFGTLSNDKNLSNARNICLLFFSRLSGGKYSMSVVTVKLSSSLSKVVVEYTAVCVLCVLCSTSRVVQLSIHSPEPDQSITTTAPYNQRRN